MSKIIIIFYLMCILMNLWVCGTSFYYISTILSDLRANKILWHKYLSTLGLTIGLAITWFSFLANTLWIKLPDGLVPFIIRFFFGSGDIDLADSMDLELEPIEEPEPEPITPDHEMTPEERARARDLELIQALRRALFWYTILRIILEITKL
jgi:hypothetical protein